MTRSFPYKSRWFEQPALRDWQAPLPKRPVTVAGEPQSLPAACVSAPADRVARSKARLIDEVVLDFHAGILTLDEAVARLVASGVPDDPVLRARLGDADANGWFIG